MRQILVGHARRQHADKPGAILSQQPSQTHDGWAVRSAGGSLRLSAGPPYHCDLYGLTPQPFDAILSVPEPNPVPKPDRWQPS
jgi:hypothetical protein